MQEEITMLKKISKKLISVLLAVTLIATTFLVFDPSILVQKSKAAVDVKKLVNTVEPAINFYVPETIYLNPVIGSGSRPYNFQYFVDCDENGTLHRSATQTTGTVYFSCSIACDSVSIAWENATVNTSTVKKTSQIVKQTINSGSTSVRNGRVKVTCTYVVGGVTYHAYAYTYMYYPELDLLTGVAASYVYKTSIGDEPKLAAFAFVTGVHYVGNNTSLSGDERAVSNYYDQYTTSSSKGAYGLSPLIPNWSSLASFVVGDDSANIPNSEIYYGETTSSTSFVESGNGGVYYRTRVRAGDTDRTWGSASNAWGTLYVDTSRITNYNQIPNLRGGFICHCYFNCGDAGKLDTFGTTDGAISVTSNIDFRNGDGKGYGMTSSESLSGAVTSSNTDYTMQAHFYFKRGNSSGVHSRHNFGFRVRPVNKGALRSAYRDVIESGIQAETASRSGWSASSQSQWTTYYNTLATALDTAGTILGKPYATASEVNSALSALNSAKANCDNIINANFSAGENADLLNRVKFYVPETIFINRDNGTNFQYIYGVDTNGNAEQGVALSSATNARIYFAGINCNPTSVKITCMGATSDNNANWTTVSNSALSSITFGGTGFNGSTANSTGKTYTSFPVNTNCSGGAFSSAIGSGNYRFIRWRADYVVDGMTFTTYAYSTCYRQPTFNAYYRHSSRQYTKWNRSPAYINAELFVNGLNVSSASGSAGTTSSGSGGSGSDNNNATNSLDTSMIIDTSRFTNYSQLPYLNARYNILNGRENGTATVTAYNSNATGTTVGIGTGETAINLAINGATLVVYMHASAVYRSKTAQNYTYINIATNCVNKSAIRTRYYNAVSMSRQQNWYTAGFDAYQNSILDMAIKTGNPVGTSTSGTENTDNLTRYSGTTTAVYLRDPNAVEDYNGNKGAAIIGKASDSKVYSYGDTVFGYYDNIPGFTAKSYSVTYGSTTKTSGVPQDSGHNNFYYVKNINTSNTDWKFYYTPNTYTVTYDTNEGEYNGTTAASTSSATFQSEFTVAQIGGTIPANPTRIGCTFIGWKCSADGLTYQPGDVINWDFAEDVTFTAQWNFLDYITYFNENYDGKSANLLNPGIEKEETITSTSSTAVDCTLKIDNQGAGAIKLNGDVAGDVTIAVMPYTFSAGTYTLSIEKLAGDIASGGVVIDLITNDSGANFNPRKYVYSGNSKNRSTTITLSQEEAAQVWGYKLWLWHDTSAVYATYEDVVVTPRIEEGSTSKGSSVFAHTYKYNFPYENLPVPEREGYTFTGWYTAASGGELITNESIAPYYDRTLYAHWTINSYTVTYDYSTNGGQSATKNSDIFVYHTAVDFSPTATKDGWSFVGWNTDENATTGITSMIMPAKDVTLYAIYNKTVTANFYSGINKATSESKSVTIWNKATSGTVTTPTSYTSVWDFRGWTNEETAASTTAKVDAGAEIAIPAAQGTVNYYALYNQLQTLNYDANTGSGAPSATTSFGYYNSCGIQNNGTHTVSTVVPVKEGYTFAGWYTNSDGTGTKYEAGSTFTNNAVSNTLYAHWTINSYKVTYNFAENGGKSATKTEDMVNYHAEIDLTPTATKDGWVFVGWNTDRNATTAMTSLTMQTRDVTLYAIYNKTLTANFYSGLDKATSESKSITIWNKETSGKVTTPTTYAPVWDFAGWTKDTVANASASKYSAGSEITIYADQGTVDFYAIYTQVQTLSYDVNTGVGSPETTQTTGYYNSCGVKNNGTHTVTTVVPTKEGYDFMGWYTTTDVSGTRYALGSTYKNVEQNDTLHAVWKIRKYTITFVDSDGTTVLQKGEWEHFSTPVYSGPAPTKASDAENEYPFIGWTPSIVTVTESAVYVATYDTVPHEFEYVCIDDKQHKKACKNCDYEEDPVDHDIIYEEIAIGDGTGYRVSCTYCDYSFESTAIKYKVDFSSDIYINDEEKLESVCTVNQRIDETLSTKYFLATIQAPSRVGLRYFVYWMDANTGEIVSSYRTYTFFVTNNCNFTPVYAYQQDYTAERNKAVISSRVLGCRSNNDSATYTLLAEHSVAKTGASIIGHGVLYTTDSANSGALTVDNDSIEKKAAGLSQRVLTGLFEVKLDPGSASTVWARSYVIDGNGNVHYGNVKSYNFPTTSSSDELAVLDTESFDLTAINVEDEINPPEDNTPTDTPDDTPTEDAPTEEETTPSVFEKLTSFFAKIIDFINKILSFFRTSEVIK